jgi:hypothetical protein
LDRPVFAIEYASLTSSVHKSGSVGAYAPI